MMSTYKELFKLYDLIENGDNSLIERFLEECSTNINQILPCKGIGVLHLAVGIEPIDKSIECTEILLKHGADPNLCSDDGMTPLHIASIWGRVENTKLLIGCGGDPSHQDLDGHSAFDYAAIEQQWEVYDYLHNVVDEEDDSVESKCSYNLDLDKILMTTGQVVAEYGPITDNQLNSLSMCRKSELVREWCDKTTLVMNKLYPTILTDTNMLVDESVTWITEDLCKHFAHNMSTNDTNHPVLDETGNSYKSCFSKKLSPNELCISGVRKLEETTEIGNKGDCSCLESQFKPNVQKQRLSVYENFSLPGSPNNVAHVNYNTKTSLKKCKERSKSKSAWNDVLIVDSSESLMTNDSSERSNSCHLNDAVAVEQNRTNERLSHSSRSSDSSLVEVPCDASMRRSSASSGVSSSFSNGGVAIATVEEEYKYEDKEEDVVLIEKRLLVSSVVLPSEELLSPPGSPDKSAVSVASSLPAAVEYDNGALRAELLRRGFRPGPIDHNTRTLYLKKLRSLRANPVIATNSNGKTYSVEVERSLRSDAWLEHLPRYEALEQSARASFVGGAGAVGGARWREGAAKTCFTYLLLDPRLSRNLPARTAAAPAPPPHLAWRTFVDSIFYVGKGKRSRPYSHLYQALTLWKRDFTTSKDKKVQHILDIWSEQVGVVCLHIFQNVIPAEAYTYEAAMIDALGLHSLENLKCGNYYGAVASWPMRARRELGLYLLYKAMLIFLNEGERQLRPDDID